MQIRWGFELKSYLGGMIIIMMLFVNQIKIVFYFFF